MVDEQMVKCHFPLMYLPIVLDLIVCQPPPSQYILEFGELRRGKFIEVEEGKTILENSVLEGCLFYILQTRAENERKL